MLHILFLMTLFLVNNAIGGPFLLNWEVLKEINNLKKNPVPENLNEIVTDETIDALSSNVRGYKSLKNTVSKMPVDVLLKSTLNVGLPNLGEFDSAQNIEMRTMLTHILFHLCYVEEKPKSIEKFIRLAYAFKDCQQVQGRVITGIYGEINQNNSLMMYVHQLINEQKEIWLDRTLNQLNKTNTINFHLRNSLINYLNQFFGFAWYESSKNDELANHKISELSYNVYLSYANAPELIKAVTDGLKSISSNSPINVELNEYFISNHIEDLGECYDVYTGKINRFGTETFLKLMGIIYEVEENLIENLMIKQEALALSLFDNSFKSWEKFSKNAFDSYKKTSDLFLDKQYKFGVIAPSSLRTKIFGNGENNGLVNQYIAGSSKGSFAHPLRVSAESSQLGLSLEEYMKVPLEYRPKYGILFFGDTLTQFSPLQQYGDDLIILKHDLEKRITFTFGTSLTKFCNQNPRIKSNFAELAAKPNDWRKIYIPFRFFPIMFFYLRPELFNNNLNFLNFGNSLVVEIQIFGEVTIKDIQAIVFTKKYPTLEEIQLFYENNIVVYNGMMHDIYNYYTFYNEECFRVYLDGNNTSENVALDYCIEYEKGNYLPHSPLMGQEAYDKKTKTKVFIHKSMGRIFVIRSVDEKGKYLLSNRSKNQLRIKKEQVNFVEKRSGTVVKNSQVRDKKSKQTYVVQAFYEKKYVELKNLEDNQIIFKKLKEIEIAQ